jgi:hypothetical protein
MSGKKKLWFKSDVFVAVACISFVRSVVRKHSKREILLIFYIYIHILYFYISYFIVMVVILIIMMTA